MGVHVLTTLEASDVVRRSDRPGLAATAFPGVPDPPQPVGAKISVMLLEAHGADDDSKKHDEGNDTP